MEETKAHMPHGPRHETTDINVWAVGKFAIGLVVITVVSLALLFGLMRYFQSQEAHEVAQTIEPDKVFPEPRLLKQESVDLEKFRATENQVLHHYAWVDQSKGVVRLPIDRAIDVLAEKGVPAVTRSFGTAPPAPAQGKKQ